MATLDREKFKILKEQHQQGFVVGINDLAGDDVYRLDIDVLLKEHPKTFNLFLLALRELHDMNFKDIMSYYQIAGIHGFPKKPWNGVDGKNAGMRDAGYCAHATPRVLTWHRPYVAMIEQALFIHIVEIADKYEDPQVKAEYQAAALKFRLPYWDYFRPRGGAVKFPGIVDEGKDTAYPYDYKIPDIFSTEVVFVRKPGDNKLDPIENPLHHFNFKEMSKPDSEMNWPFLNFTSRATGTFLNPEQTSRHPWDAKKIYQEKFKWNNPTRVNTVLNELRMDSNRIVLDMVLEDYYKQYETFAHAGYKRPTPDDLKDDDHKGAIDLSWGEASGNLEALHGLYHGLIGGLTDGGAMSRVGTAAFDSVFWIHHCQIERIFSIWQTVHAFELDTCWFKDHGLAEQDLLPFLRAPNTDGAKYWTSNSVRELSSFGSKYEDIKSTPQETRENFDRLYRWSVPKGRIQDGAKPPADMEPLDLSESEFFPITTQPKAPTLQTVDAIKQFSENLVSRAQIAEFSLASEASISADEEYWDWYIDDQVERLALDGAFSIMYFINLAPNRSFNNNADLSLAPTLAGVTYTFAAPREGCDNCGIQSEQAHVVRNTNPITSLLLDYVSVGQLESLRPEHVKEFLIERLRWRVVSVNGEPSNPREMRENHGFRIGISYKKTHGTGAEPPVVGREDGIIEAIIQRSSNVIA